jgi:hypothetical protein
MRFWQRVLHTQLKPIPSHVLVVSPSPFPPGLPCASSFSTNSKQKGGTVGKLTNGLVDRTEYYRHAMLMALIPFMPVNQSLY